MNVSCRGDMVYLPHQDQESNPAERPNTTLHRLNRPLPSSGQRKFNQLASGRKKLKGARLVEPEGDETMPGDEVPKVRCGQGRQQIAAMDPGPTPLGGHAAGPDSGFSFQHGPFCIKQGGTRQRPEQRRRMPSAPVVGVRSKANPPPCRS